MKPGWYAVLRHWEIEERIIPGAEEWGAEGWIERWMDIRTIIHRSSGPLASEEDAKKWAFANEISGFDGGQWVDVG